MSRGRRVSLFLGITALVLFYGAPQAAAQTAANPPAAAVAAPKFDTGSDEHGAGRVGMGFRASSLGLGAEVAVEVTRWANLRGGFNFFRYSRGYDHSGIHYDGDLRWTSAEGHFDWYPFSHFARTFHVSPGLLAYNDNKVNATASVVGGNNFTLNGVTYESNPAVPVNGTANLYFNKVAPTILVGFGNLVPRTGKHISVNFEAGVAFEGAPKIGLNLNGSACLPGTADCSNIATNPTTQSNVEGEETILINDLNPFKYYPIVSLTLGYRF